MNILKLIIIAILSYFLGCFNTAAFISTRLFKSDIRTHGSGNPGSANMMRAFGAKAGVAVFLVDCLKGFLAMQLPWLVGDASGWGAFLCGLSVVIGHDWPATMHFKGGKGVATTIGCGFAMAPLLTFAILIASLAVVAITKYVSVGGLFGIGLASIILWFFDMPWQQKTLMTILFIFVVYKHRTNIARLRAGTEAKFNSREKNAE